MKLARLAGPPLTGIPNTMNTKHGHGDQRRPDPCQYGGGGGHCQREQRDNAGDRGVVAQAGDAIRDRRGDHPADDGHGHRRGDGPSARRARRKASADAEPAARLGISTLRTTNQDDSAWVSPGQGRDNVGHYQLTSGPCRHGREGPGEGLLGPVPPAWVTSSAGSRRKRPARRRPHAARSRSLRWPRWGNYGSGKLQGRRCPGRARPGGLPRRNRRCRQEGHAVSAYGKR